MNRRAHGNGIVVCEDVCIGVHNAGLGIYQFFYVMFSGK